MTMPWENDPVVSRPGSGWRPPETDLQNQSDSTGAGWRPPADDQPWLSDEPVYKKFTYQPPLTPAPEKSWWQKAGQTLAQGQTTGYTSALDAWKQGIRQRSNEWREARQDTAALQRQMKEEGKSGPEVEFAMSPKERGLVMDFAGNAALGFVGGGGGRIALKTLAEGAGTRAAPATVAEFAHEAGYVIPPEMAGKGDTVTSTLAAWGGRPKIAQTASLRNQSVTNQIAAKDLGLPPDTMLTERAFNEARRPANEAYRAAENSGVPIKQDMTFLDDLLALGPQSEEMAKFFPKTAKNDLIRELQDEFGTGAPFSPKAGIQAVRRLRFKATSNLKSFDNPDKVELGKAQRGAAEAIDDLIERNLADAGKPSLMQAYRSARQLIAKSHDVESATDTATGEVDAHALARLANKGKPLTGGAKVIADTANAFPRAMQAGSRVAGTGHGTSAIDFLGTVLSAMHGRFDLMAAFMGHAAMRPLAREITLSRLMQHQLAPPPIHPNNSLLSIMRPVQRPAQPAVPTFSRP